MHDIICVGAMIGGKASHVHVQQGGFVAVIVVVISLGQTGEPYHPASTSCCGVNTEIAASCLCY